MKRILLLMMVSGFISINAFAQSNVQGFLVDADTEEALIGAAISIAGTTTGTVTDINGMFVLKNVPSDAKLTVSYVGYRDTELDLAVLGTGNLGNVKIKADVIGLAEIEVVASVAIDRKTPVAVSSIGRKQIEEVASNQEFPELLKTSPGVYATKQGGGYGDSRIAVRGFNDVNVAVLINGVPVNDMENGRVYWSNWAGLTDVTRTMQVQRGLGASKVAVPSIGGTINILTNTTEANKGGSLYYGRGNNNYEKTAFSLSTGLTEDNWAVSVQGARITGDGWAEGTEFIGWNYFFNVSKIINDSHTISFTGFGAPQRHGQRQSRLSISDVRNAPQERRFNPDWGILNGEVVHVEDNFYHKPQFSLNHYWTIDATSELSTAVYASYGTGGGGGAAGTAFDRTGDQYSPIDLDAAVDRNLEATDGNAISYLRASRNDHNWYGVLSTYTKNVSQNFNFLAGVDYRYYKGLHFSEVTNLLGASYALDNDDVNNPNRQLRVGDKRDYNNDGLVNWAGGFLQGEYTLGDLNAFVTLSGSNTQYQRVDHFQYFNAENRAAILADPAVRAQFAAALGDDDDVESALAYEQESEKANFFGYQVKGGANYNLTRNHNVFANLGYFEKAPDFRAVYQNFANGVNENAENQKILSFELGYGYRSSTLNGNINLYRTTWMDRTFTRTINGDEPNEIFFANILGVDATHQGIEIDAGWQPVAGLDIRVMASFGDWTWQNNIDSTQIFDEDRNVVGTIDRLAIKGLKVGNAAQTTAAFSLDYNLTSNFKFGGTLTYFGNNYADFNPIDRQVSSDVENITPVQPRKLDEFALLDVKANYRFKIGENDAALYANVTNLLDTEYISDSQDGNLTPDAALHWFGVGRQFTVGMKFNF